MAPSTPDLPGAPAPGELPPSGDGATGRPRYRPPIGMPHSKERRTANFLLGVLLHALIILLLIVPFTSPELMSEVLGAGGLGPAGGGGGGNRGTGGQVKQERLQYVRVAPAPTPPPVVRPPEVKPVVPPIVPPPTPTPPVPQPTPQPPTPQPAATSGEVKSETVGTGGGSGNDGSSGSGPGSGGGVGSGVGTGRGSATGPGTGGGPGSVYPPAPTELFLPPLPVPNKAKGTIVVIFDVDSTGRVLDLQFQPTKDGNYNRKLREALAAIRFRPAVNAQGIPIRAKTEITYSL
ncbi:MAG: hypothetical protein IBJ03_14895 [Gemmatimonadaceae bacterium]|nr:hypothetical protein [Gemmatimonadaceae bacterium]